MDDGSSTRLDLTGFWLGRAEGFSSVPEEPDAVLRMTLRSAGTRVLVDTLWLGGQRVSAQAQLDGHAILITYSLHGNDVCVEFAGTAPGIRMEGVWFVREVSLGDTIVYTGQRWYAELQ